MRYNLAQSEAGRFFPSESRLEHHANYYMPPTTANNIDVYMFACWEVIQLLAEGCWFPLGTPVSFANKSHDHDITGDVEKHFKHESIQSMLFG